MLMYPAMLLTRHSPNVAKLLLGSSLPMALPMKVLVMVLVAGAQLMVISSPSARA